MISAERQIAPKPATAGAAQRPAFPVLQRKCACGGSADMEGECEECKKKSVSLQRRARSGGAAPAAAPPIVHDVLRSPGKPLDAATRAFMEPRFGHDFSKVRVHADGHAAESTRAVNALAYTVGNDVVFDTGHYRPETGSGRKLLTHELAHVVQQSGHPRPPSTTFLRVDESGEADADRAAAEISASRQQTPHPFVARPALARRWSPVNCVSALQRQEKKTEPAKQNVSGVTVYCSEDDSSGNYIVFATPSKQYAYKLTTCQIPEGSYETTVTVKGAQVHWDFGAQVKANQEYRFGFEVKAGQENPATLFKNQRTVHVEVVHKPLSETPAEAEVERPIARESFATRLANFKKLVKAGGQARMKNNRSALADWRAFLESQLKPEQVEHTAYAQNVRDLQLKAEHEGGMALSAYDEAVSSANPIRRYKAAGQVEGRFRACTGCHLENLAQQFEKEARFKDPRDWTAPVDVLKQYAAEEQQHPTPRPQFAKPLKGEGLPPEAEIHNPQLPGASAASASLARLQPFLQILGPGYYDVLPGDLLVNHPRPQEVLREIVTRIEGRRHAYLVFSNKIGEPDFDYLVLRPIVRELLPAQDDDVQQAVEDEIKTAEAWEIVEKIVMGGVTIALLLLAIFPPTSAAGVAGLAALETAAGAYAIYSGVHSFEQGYLLSLGKGAHDVLDPEQQEAAGMMMAMGAFNVALGAIGLKTGVTRGIRLVRSGPAVAMGAAGATARVIDGIEGEAGGNKIVISEIASGKPQVKVTAPDGKVLYDGPLDEMPQSGFGGGKGPSSGNGGGGGGGRGAGPSLFQQQRAAALEQTAAAKEAEALGTEGKIATASSAERAARLRARAEMLRAEAAKLRSQAAEYASGAKSATADLPTPEEVEQELDKIALGGGKPQKGFSIPLSEAERTPEAIARLQRSLMSTARGRVVFRVEGGGGMPRLNVDPVGNVTTTSGTLNLNFGSLERALEFFAKRGAGARIIAFEVDEAWVQSIRSAAMPEHLTSGLGRDVRLVDVSYAEDQIQIPETLLPEMEKFVVPGSGKVLLKK
jgi:hypothetical protein